MHDRPLVHLDDGFGGRRAVAQSTVWSFGVVVFPPFFDQDLGFTQAVEDFTIQELVAEPGVEALAVSVLPRGSWFDVSRLGTNRFDPVLDSLRNELRAVVRPNERGNTAQDEQVAQRIDDVA